MAPLFLSNNCGLALKETNPHLVDGTRLVRLHLVIARE